jgi:uncharacterized protein
MKLRTRDLLAKLLVAALDHPEEAAAIQCLARYCARFSQDEPLMPVERFLLPAPGAERSQVFASLEPLLIWHREVDAISPAPALASEWAEIVEKLVRYRKVLDEWQLDAAASALAAALRKSALLFNHHLFFEVHEVLEAQWVHEGGEVKLFLQGLIQVAVAFYHLQRGNLRGALSLLHEGLEKIRVHQPAFLGVALQDFVAGVTACREELVRLGAEQLAQFQPGMIPQMRVFRVPG